MPPRQWRVPDGRCVYAIGDIHGRLDLLDELLRCIAADSRRCGPASKSLVFLGDYVDRGPDSRGVIARLLDDPLPEFGKTFLLGNHEQVLLRYLDGDLRIARHWLEKGGCEALRSYGLAVTGAHLAGDGGLERLRAAMVRALPAEHVAFLRRLRVSHREGDYYFAHAGILPGVPIAQQRERDLVWIRARFHRSAADHGVRVVHGHEVVRRVEIHPNRIAIDTGAYQSGVLSCLALQGEGLRLLQTAPS